jgi:hypothetical protein
MSNVRSQKNYQGWKNYVIAELCADQKRDVSLRFGDFHSFKGFPRACCAFANSSSTGSVWVNEMHESVML